ncbi:hypothetical protein AAC978_00010 [Desulfitobacterium sp. THU1]|uniref:hypothetical protein n=1 Tax=Desulfitobacterium sp. THU1 TaxID=3138072 RepID=UPI00311F8976
MEVAKNAGAYNMADESGVLAKASLVIDMDKCAANYKVRLNMGGDIIKRLMSADNTRKLLEWASDMDNERTYIVLTSALHGNFQMIKHSAILDILITAEEDVV